MEAVGYQELTSNRLCVPSRSSARLPMNKPISRSIMTPGDEGLDLKLRPIRFHRK